MEFTPTAEQPALATVAGDQCSACGAPLAPDQRYCVQCGQRRGQSRLPVTQAAATAPPRAPRAPRFGMNTALIAGVGTLLLAMGVGVLIGHSSRQPEPARAASPVQVVTLGGGASTAGGVTAGTGAGAAKKAKSAGKAASSADVAKAAKKIKGTNLTLPKKSVVKVGTPGTGPGYDKKSHKFTGNFFGG